MKVQRLVYAFLFCIAAAVTGTAQAPAQAGTATTSLSPLEQAMIANEKAFIVATTKRDKDYFKRTLTGDYSLVGYDGQLHDREEIETDLSSGGVDLMPYNMKVVEISQGTAIVTYDVVFRVPAAEDQGPPPRYQHWSSVWVKQGDAWKLKFQQTTPTHWGDW
jgi:subtilisin family serine protease